MPRAQNAHAYVNAGFLVELDQGQVQAARICFGGINPEFVHATATEEYLIGKEMYTNETVATAIELLTSELQPDYELPDASPEYRKNLAISLFYKFILNTAAEENILPEYVSGGEILERELSHGHQETSTNYEVWPMTKNVPKYDGLVQTSGEANFVNDLPPLMDEL